MVPLVPCYENPHVWGTNVVIRNLPPESLRLVLYYFFAVWIILNPDFLSVPEDKSVVSQERNTQTLG